MPDLHTATINNNRKCILCNNSTNNLFTINMPVFMGVNMNNKEEYFENMIFTSCTNCGEVQINNLLKLDVLYQNNHNINVIGKIWSNHYIELSKFIDSTIKDKTILEISDPSAKLAKLSKQYKYWYIIEPNPENVKEENIEFINGFFDETFDYVKNIDVIIHSHLLEHIHNPNSFFKKCYDILNENGTMIISIPNMEYLLNNNYFPNNILHFEHTFYLDDKILEFLSNSNGFKIIEIQEYNNHSTFYKLKKVSNISFNKYKNSKIQDKFKIIHNNAIEKIININNELSKYTNYNIYLFGAHVSSQFLIFNGLNIENIKSIIDNDKNKQNYKLYGTKFTVNNIDIIKDIGNCIIICSHIGVYYKEICKQLLEINNDIILL